MGCVGYENTLSDCSNQVYPQSTCSRKNVAGLLCGYGKNPHTRTFIINVYSQIVLMVTFVWLVVNGVMKEQLKYVLTISGDLSQTLPGVCKQLK